MTTITQNKIGKVVPWGGGAEGRTESKKVLFLTMVKKKKLCSKKLNIVTSKEHLVLHVPWLHRSQSELLKMHALLN